MWTLDTLVDGEVASYVVGEATLLLADDGTATGSTGCRGFVGTSQAAGDALTLTAPDGTGLIYRGGSGGGTS